jgi:imidazolonepropionase-like amidohydrolase
MRFFPILLSCIVSLCIPAVAQNLVIRDAKIYTSPDAPPVMHATVLVRAGKIAALGRDVRASAGTKAVQCDGCVVFAGFWNTHVHFTGPQWNGAATRSTKELTRDMQVMLTHSGFTTVVDVASDPTNTVVLRRRVESGEVAGPNIYTSGFGLYPPHGIPFYLDDLPEKVRAQLAQPDSPAAATQAVRMNQAPGSNVVKLFTGSYLSPDNITHMSLEIAKAAAQAGHDHQQLVFAHPSDLQGVQIAMDSGVDVLAHAPDTIAGVDAELVNKMVSRHMAMTPTLKLFSASSHIDKIRDIVADFHRAGGKLLFGTDTGFLTDYDVTEEYQQLQLAGLTFRDVLSMLTINPVKEFHLEARAGELRVGYDGDLTVLSEDPSNGDLRKFTHVLYAVRAGRVVFNGGVEH